MTTDVLGISVNGTVRILVGEEVKGTVDMV